MIKFNNLNNLSEYLKKTEADKIYMKKINSLNISFTDLLTRISQTFSIFNREIEGIKENTLSIYSSITSINSYTDNLSSSITNLNSEISSIKIDTLNLYNSLSSITAGGDYNYMKQLNKVSADTYIDYDYNYTVDDVEKFSYSLDINNRTSDTNKLSYVIQTNISNTGLSLTQDIDRLGLKITSNSPLTGNIKTLDLIACNSTCEGNISNCVCSNIKFINSDSGYFKKLYLPEHTKAFDFANYTMDDNYALTIKGVDNYNSFSNMKGLNIFYDCPNMYKTQGFYKMSSCALTITQNSQRIQVNPYINDTTIKDNSYYLMNTSNIKFTGITLGQGNINNYVNTLTLSGLYWNKTGTETFNNYGYNLTLTDGTFNNIIFNNYELNASLLLTYNKNYLNNCTFNNFENITLGYITRTTTGRLSFSGVKNFSFNGNVSFDSIYLQGTLTQNNRTMKGKITNLYADLSANDLTFKFSSFTNTSMNLTLNGVNVSGITNTDLTISGNDANVLGGNFTSLICNGPIGLSNINVAELTVNLNGMNPSSLTFNQYNNVNITNMSFVDEAGIYYKNMLKLDNPFNNVYGLNITNQNFNNGINDVDVSLLNSGIIQHVNYAISSVNMGLIGNKSLNANWLCNCDNIQYINVMGLNPDDIIFGGDGVMFNNVCSQNTDTNEIFTLKINMQYSDKWINLRNSSKIKPFTYDASLNQIYFEVEL